MLAFIGGSGFEKFESFEPLQGIERETPFGLASTGIKSARLNGVEILFVSRHGEKHELLPSEVNYRANVFALKRAGAKAIVSFSAVGSLRGSLKPGDMVVPHQYVDRTKGLRAHTFSGQGWVSHVSLAEPMSTLLSSRIQDLVSEETFASHFGQTYICIEGPCFSTKAESHHYRDLGADIIGMTHFPEYALAREAGLPYLPCCFVTDYDCWNEDIPHVTLVEVLELMKKNNGKAMRLAQKIVKLGPSFWENCPEQNLGLRMGLMTPKDSLSTAQQATLSILMS